MEKKEKSIFIFDRISKIAIYLLVFLLPLWFLPWTVNVLDFNKQSLLLFLTLVAFLSWLIKVLTTKEIRINFNFLYLPVIVLLLVAGLSTLFSVSSYGSFWGWPLNINQSFLTLLGSVLLFFLVVNVFQKREEVVFLFLLAVFSGFLASFYAIFQLFGKFLFPFDFSRLTSFNTVGTLNSLAVFAAANLVIAIGLISFLKNWLRWFLVLAGAVLLVLLFFVNFWLAWLGLAVGSSLFLVFGFVSRQGFEVKKLILPLLIFALSVLFIFFRAPLPGAPATPLEISVSYPTSFEIALKALKERPFFGSGPGTFIYQFAKFKPIELNQTIFWNIRFDSGAAKILDLIGTLGIFGILTFLALLISFLVLAFGKIRKKLEEESAGNSILALFLGILAGWLILTLAIFLYPSNLSLESWFWLTLAGFLVLGKEKVNAWQVKPASPLLIFLSIFLIITLIGLVGLFLTQGQRYAAEIKYLQGLREFNLGQIDSSLERILAASRFNPNQDNYWRDLSQIYLQKINQELVRTDIGQDQLLQNLSVLAANAINSANQATTLEPKKVTNWIVRGFTYRSLIGLIGGTEDWAVTTYQRAAELEPTNPYIFTEIGRVFLAKARLSRQQGVETGVQENLSKAKENLEKAIGLKSDYAPAHFQMAMVYDFEGKTEEAIAKLEETKGIVPWDTGLAFQLGMIYYRTEKFEKAKSELERAILLDPNYSNARYFLGLIYDREGKKEEAISQFVKIEELNPGNEEVKKILANLREGKPALEGILPPGTAPIQERPEELEKPIKAEE